MRLARLSTAALLLVAACGKRGAAPSACGQNPPVVRAIAASVAAPRIGSIVQLTAAIDDLDQSPQCGSLQESFSYRWSLTQLPAGSQARLNDGALSNPSLKADVAGDYGVALVATDSTNLVRAPARLRFRASSCGAALPAFAARQVLPCGEVSPTVAGIDVLAGGTVGAALRVGARQITDLNCLASGVWTYAWQLLSTPAGSRALLDDPSAATPSLLPDQPGNYQLAVTVTNSRGRASQPVYRILQVMPCGSALPIWSPSGGVTVSVRDPQPTAATQVHAGGLVTLTPHATDPNTCGSIPVTLAYRWSLIARPPGSQAILNY